MKVVVTGSSCGMGTEIAKRFLEEGHDVFGIDIKYPDDGLVDYDKYIHFICDVSHQDMLPDIDGVNILINNAGVQNSGHDIDINLKGVIFCTEKYGLQPAIKSILNQSAASTHTGADFAEYVASKGGVTAYTRWTAREIAQYGATCNSLSIGGVTTAVNRPVMEDPDMWDQIMMLTPLRKWASEKEAADWVYFLTMINKSATGQDFVVDNGEILNSKFIWPKE